MQKEKREEKKVAKTSNWALFIHESFHDCVVHKAKVFPIKSALHNGFIFGCYNFECHIDKKAASSKSVSVIIKLLLIAIQHLLSDTTVAIAIISYW